MSAEMMLAKSCESKNTFLSSEWCYSTELRLLKTQLIMAPLFKAFHDWSVIRTIGNIILYVILICSYTYFMK